MANKIYKKLPVILQTDAVKNFFESTVEQLYSKANVEQVSGFIGKKTSNDKNVNGEWIYEKDINKQYYGLSPVVNNTNANTNVSENFIFYDEFINILDNYNVDTLDHNQWLKSDFQSFLPPIEYNKFLNYQDYYWSTTGPTAISISGTLTDSINVDKDIIGKSSYTPTGGKAFKNGMKITFAGDYVIDNTKYVGKEFIVEGVGDSITLVPVDISYANGYNNPQTDKDYILLGRGSANRNVWSRVNFWYHKENFTDAGDSIPDKTTQAERPILEFDRDIELYNHGVTSKGNVDVSSTEISFSDIVGADANNVAIDTVTIESGTKIIFPNDATISANVYVASVANSSLSNAISLSVATDPDDSSKDFVLSSGDIIYISSGFEEIGKEYYFNDDQLKLAQLKSKTNTAPLFNLYNDEQKYLGDPVLFPQNNFYGNKIFGFADGTGTNDRVYKFPLAYRSFKNASEISFENYIGTQTYQNVVLGSTSSTDIKGYYYYKILRTTDIISDDLILGKTSQYHNTFKNAHWPSEQRIEKIFEITRTMFDEFQQVFDLGCVPGHMAQAQSGFNIRVKKNGKTFTDFTYVETDDKITIDRVNYDVGDIFEISMFARGLKDTTNNTSKHELPIGWSHNPDKEEITEISEPEYLPHFKNYMERQPGFTGDALSSNNFSSLPKQELYGTDIVQSNQDLILGAFLLDDQPHNLIEALRFCSSEYNKYKKRFFKELDNYYNLVDFNDYSNEEILEKVLRNLISFSVGKNVFGSTFILPFGDNFTKETTIINDITTNNYTPSFSADLDKIENSLLVYLVRDNVKTLLTIDEDYTLTYSPITIEFKNYSPQLLDTLEFKLYNSERDSVECPPTPSTMGLYPLYSPEKITDESFQTPQELICGHDGSKTPIYGDDRDDIVLEFEKRIYNSAKAEFRSKNEYPELNELLVRTGRWRHGKAKWDIYHDMLQTNFENWVIENKVDPVVNELYDNTNQWTYNYRGSTTVPGHWRGWYEYYYDTVRPHTHPWEMLGFIKKPSWWDDQYITTTYTDYGSNNRPMWEDLEKGIIRQGDRENVTNDEYKNILNPYQRRANKKRVNLIELIPVHSNASLRTPYEITGTGVTTFKLFWNESEPDTTQGFKTTSFISDDGINVQYDATHRYITSYNIPNYSRSKIDETLSVPEYGTFKSTYRIPNNVNYNTVSNATANNGQVEGACAILVNGLPLYSPISTAYDVTYNYELGFATASSRAQGDIAQTDADGQIYTAIPTSDMSNSTVWGNETTHSGVIGWAFDGLPIYGPYGYTDASNTSSSITNIKSAFKLKAGNRGSGPQGAHTGEFVQDYELDASVSGTNGYADRWNTRYGYTPDSPSTKIRYYVATIDDSDNPMFPYAVGGSMPSAGITWQGNYYNEVLDIDTNKNGTAPTNSTATYARKSEQEINITADGNQNKQWKFGDGAPVENAWKYSETYPFAIAELLCLSNPGGFATVFSDPTKIITAPANEKKYLDITSRKNWKFKDKTHFNIHGDIDSDGNMVTNIGYSQFIHSWLSFQGLNTSTQFAEKVRNLNTKLGHRISGFIDKDTMTMSLDQFSTTGTGTNLIVPSENITVAIHNSPYKSRNMYSGVIIQKVTGGYKVKGYDKNLGYFEILESKTDGQSSRIEVGGEPAPYVEWKETESYNKGTIVEYQGNYFEASVYAPSNTTFNTTIFRRLSRLPQINFESATVYQETTGNVIKVEYETVYETKEEVFDFLVSLGRYQKHLGYTFGNFDESINTTRDWLYAGEQFLFWTTGSWQSGNTLELSPMANKVTFETEVGFVAQIKRSEYNLFNLTDKEGKSINPKECSIIREDKRIDIIPPTGREIYSAVLFVREIEHAILFDNETDFADTIFDPAINQKQSRVKIKGSRTANWDGRFISEGFIIENDALKPNLDNLAESMGRYHELGFIPVEKQVYETARNLFGYQEKDYLSELQINDDDQFEFYKGFIQNKGTNTSLSRIGRSNAIIQGDMTVYDEWAVSVGDFGDLENDQSVELKLVKSDFVQDPQLFTLAFPEDTTGVIEKIDILQAKHQYFNVPEIKITAPTGNNKLQATAVASLNSSGELSSFTVTEQGKGYTDTVGLTVVTSDIHVENVSSIFAIVDHKSSAPITSISINTYDGSTISESNANIGGLGNITLKDEIGNVTATINLSSITTSDPVSNIVSLINLANVNSAITAFTMTSTENIGGASNNATTVNAIRISGNDFTLGGDAGTLANLNLTAGRYQPRQRYAVDVANNTVKSNITITVDNTVISDATQYDFDAGDRWQITAPSEITGNSATTFTLNTGIVNSTTTMDANNIIAYDGVYSFVDVFIDGEQIINPGYETRYAVSNATTISFPDVGLLPNGKISSGANVYVVERATIDFEDTYQGDLPGSTMNIKVSTHDDIAAHVKSVRIYDITPDAKDDEVILIDIDDTTKFLKKPSGVRESNIWPLTSNVSFRGITDKKYNPLPNAGYVDEDKINYSAFDVGSVSNLFAPTVKFTPEENDFIHIAKSENKDWNVYKLKEANIGPVTFVEQDAATETAFLYSERSLFNYIDTNQLLQDDLGRYLDYFLVIKKADISEEFVIWTNEDIVRRKSVHISNFGRPEMIVANIGGIAPTEVLSISNISPAISGFYGSNAQPIGNSTVQITSVIADLSNGDVVEFFTSNTTDYVFSIANVDYVTKSNTATLNNTSLSSRTLTFDNDVDYNFANVTVGGVDINLDTLESDEYTANLTFDGYINGSNIIIPEANITSSNTTVILTRTKINSFNLAVANINTHGANIVSANSIIRLQCSNTDYNNSSFIVESVDTGNNTITIGFDLLNDDIDPTSNVDQTYLDLSTLGITGYVYEKFYPLHGQRHVISNLSTTGFTVTQANVTQSIGSDDLSFGFFGATEITSTSHGLSSGQLVKLDANAYSGFYYVENATENSFKIDAPFNNNINKTGNIITEGITITTTEDHGINVSYTGKKIAVHLAEPRYYNQVYKVSDIPTANTIQINSAFGFYPYNSVQANAILSTLDHNKVEVNNAIININNLNSPESIAEEFNRQIDLRRGFYYDDDTISIPILNNLECSEAVYNGVPASHIQGSSPYVPRLPNVEGMVQTGNMVINPALETRYGFPGEVVDDIGIAYPGGTPGFYDQNPGQKLPSDWTGNNFYNPASKVGGTPLDNLNIPLFKHMGAKSSSRKPVTDMGSPVIDPTKAMSTLPIKVCDVCAPAPPPVSSTITNNKGNKFITKNYGGTISISGSGTGKGARKWQNEWSGYYRSTGTKRGQVTQSGGQRHMPADGLAGAITWSDNGSRDGFDLNLTFSDAGTFYVHAYYTAPQAASTSYIKVDGVTLNPKHMGKTGNMQGAGNTMEITVTAGQVVNIVGLAKYGSNHWNSIGFHISTKPSNLSLSALVRDPADTSDQSNTTTESSTTNSAGMQTDFVVQSTTKWNVDDEWIYNVGGSGTIEILFDMYSGADGIEVFQGDQTTQSRLIGSTQQANLIALTESEKSEILTNAPKRQTGTGSGYYAVGVIRPFQVSSHSAPNNTGVKFGGKIAFDFDKSQGDYIKVKIHKSSSVYRFLIKYPKEGPPVSNPKENPTPIHPCATASNGNTSVGGGNLPNTPVTPPGGGTGGGTGSGGTGGGGTGGGGGGNVGGGTGGGAGIGRNQTQSATIPQTIFPGSGGSIAPALPGAPGPSISYGPVITAQMNNPFIPKPTPSAIVKDKGGVGSIPFLGNPSTNLLQAYKPTAGYGAMMSGPYKLPTNSYTGGKNVKLLADRNLFNYSFGNFVDFGLPSSAGFRFLPNQLRKTVKTTITNNLGRLVPLTGSNYVNTTVQKVTGGKTVPLATPLRGVIPQVPTKLRAIEVLDYGYSWASGLNSPFFNKTNTGVVFSANKVGDNLILPDGSSIRNILGTTTGIDANNIAIMTPGDFVAIQNFAEDGVFDGFTPAGTTIDDGTAPPDKDKFDFNHNGSFTIEPLIRTPEGNYIPGGNPITCNLEQPTPGISIPLDRFEGVKPGDELIINKKKFTFQGSDPKAIVHTLKCGQNGAGFTVKDTKVYGKDAIRISSCSNAPLTIRDGCAGGVYKEVLDFHVVRGFEQTVTETSNTAVLPAMAAGGNSALTYDVTYGLMNAEGNIYATLGGGGQVTDSTGLILSSSTSGRSTGGSGYQVGDRLRLVGGTPVSDPYGSITEICIDSPGSGYSDSANIKVYIGDGNAPGSGAKAGTVILDSDGGIKEIYMVTGGEGYDVTRPPPVKIIDLNDNGTVISATATAKVSGFGASVPPRVAKFVVTSVDAVGTITSLQIIDRGIYKVFPADLTMGIPLEYDFVNLGDETGQDGDGNFIQGTGLGQFDPLANGERLGSPGGYDPINDSLGGGSGARVFLTSREIPDCSEKGTAKGVIGFPDQVVDINIPEDMAACFNNNLPGRGDDDDIWLEPTPINDCITGLDIKFPGYDGIRIDEPTPGFLDKLGIPKGDYQRDMLCMVATITTPNYLNPRSKSQLTGFDIIDEEGFAESRGGDTENVSLEIFCVDNLKTDPNSLFGVGGSSAGDVGKTFTTDLYQYELRNPQGLAVNTAKVQQECQVLYLESHRFANTSQVNAHVHTDDGNVTVSNYDKVWIDDYNNNGWAYLENNVIVYGQEPLVDSKFVNNSIIYDAETGEKDYDLYEYDPFKGIIPGFIDREITFKGESDPVVYNNARTKFAEKDVGKVWWDTSTIRYRWYEQGSTNRQRWLDWGSVFPGSAITLYEWVKSTNPPITYTGSGIPKNSVDFLTTTIKNDVTGYYENCYYFWVQNKAELDNEVVIALDRKYSTVDLAKKLADPVGQGIPLISFISNESFMLTNTSQIIKDDDNNLQINLSKNLNPIGQKHTAWKLLRESDNNSIIPDDLSLKLIDSICGIDSSGKSVPDPLLSEVEKYGVAFRPRQTMFKDVKEARKELAYFINEKLAGIKLNSSFVNWDADLPTTRTYIENINWFNVLRVDQSNNKIIRYDSTYKPILKVGSVSELQAITGSIKDGAIIQVQPNVNSKFELWKYIASTNTFEQISIESETIKLKDTFFTDETNTTMQTEIRALLLALRDTVFANDSNWNEIFFGLMKYAYMEQEQLSWAFKSSYVFIEKEEEDLTVVDGFKVDNFDKVLKYFEDAKPYTAKVREYKDGKSPAKELIQYNQISDFDKPPYPDSATGNIRILDDFLQSDSNILQTNNNYTKYFTFHSNANVSTPIRKIKDTIVFDRTNTILTDFVPLANANADYSKIETNTSIATNIVTLMSFGNTASGNANVSANAYYRYADRLFKFDPSVQTKFKAELDAHFSVTDSTTNANIISSEANILAAINAGSLNGTLDLVTEKVGGKFRGTTLDANIFTKVVSGADSETYQSQFGFGSDPFDRLVYDNNLNVENYVGSFTEQSTLTKDNVAYEGFDGVSFQRVGYGERVPEEMALFDPYETFVMNITSHKHLQGNTSLTAASSNASTVEFQITMDLFGTTEYLRKLQDGTSNTVLSANLLIADTEITVGNANVLPEPVGTVNGVVWVGSERIEYTRKDLSNNKLSGLIRGTKGTTIQNWYSSNTVLVWDGSESQTFKDFNHNTVQSNIWLDTTTGGTVASSLTDKGNIANTSSIMRFLHNL